VMAAAVILDPARPIAGLADSKQLSERQRDALEEEIKEKALAWAVARAEVDEIDTLNILWASMLAMERAVMALNPAPQLALVDGNRCPPGLLCRAEAIIKGDQTVPAISAASILAKVARDRELFHLDTLYPGYGFARHKGYPTKDHVAALEQLGITPVHRRTFGPVRKLL
jgi:ribonuclease HII